MKDPYGQYQDARNASWNCLLQHRVQSLPVSVARILRAEGVHLGSYHDNAAQLRRSGFARLMDNDGFTLQDGAGRLYVYYNEQCSPQRTRFTLAHELGHIYLGHLDGVAGVARYSPRNREPLETQDPAEREANIFASRLLAPACVLWQLDVHSPEDISRLCQISITAAQFRAQRMEALYRREAEWLQTKGKSCFLQSPQERQVLEQFERYIYQFSQNP